MSPISLIDVAQLRNRSHPPHSPAVLSAQSASLVNPGTEADKSVGHQNPLIILIGSAFAVTLVSFATAVVFRFLFD